MTDLGAYAALAEQVAGLEAHAGQFRFTPEHFEATCAEVLEVAGLVIRKPTKRILGYAGLPKLPFEVQDMTFGHDWYAERETYRRIGLWMLDVLFSGRDYAGLSLIHPKSQIAEFYVFVEREVVRPVLLRDAGPTRYVSFDYIPMELPRHPLSDPSEGGVELRPMFRFGWRDTGARFRGDPETADQVILSFTPEGLCAMAQILLDFAMPWGTRDEINFEPPVVGFGGAQPLSLEARFWLPGSIAFHTETLGQMEF